MRSAGSQRLQGVVLTGVDDTGLEGRRAHVDVVELEMNFYETLSRELPVVLTPVCLGQPDVPF